jgi:oligopeptide/dipeptide ABC transporter ATP-binding protein
MNEKKSPQPPFSKGEKKIPPPTFIKGEETPLLRVKQVSKSFASPQKWSGTVKSEITGKQELFWAVRDVSLNIYRRESFGLVGESGCGKTTLAKIILRLFPKIEMGSVEFGDSTKDVFDYNCKELRQYRRKVQMIFQEPDVSLNPGMSIGAILKEAIKRGPNSRFKRSEIGKLQEELLQTVNLNDRRSDYPDNLSGGEKRRVNIIRALAVKPELIIADEPLLGLDISLRHTIINRFIKSQEEGLTLIFISHNIHIINLCCSRVAVMYAGRIVEQGCTTESGLPPKHPYTYSLLQASRQLEAGIPAEKTYLGWELGEVPLSGCAFRKRCFFYHDQLSPREKIQCECEIPELKPISEQHHTACHFWKKLPN